MWGTEVAAMPRFQQSGARGSRNIDSALESGGVSQNDKVYFESYANTGIHEEMIKVRGSHVNGSAERTRQVLIHCCLALSSS